MNTKESFYLTFGQISPAKNGWIKILADDYQLARDIAFKSFGENWANLYTEDDFDMECFPAGELGILK